jgi:hypothetical protein
MTVYVAQVTKVREDGKTYFAPANKTDLDMLKDRVSEGQVIHSWFSDEEKRSQDQSNLFHKLRDRYAEEQGYDRRHAKWELKYLCSPHDCVIEQVGTPEPPDMEGELVNLSWLWPDAYARDKWVWLKSEAAMTGKEHSTLIEQTRGVMRELGIEESDIA